MVKHPKQKGSKFEILIYNDMKTYIIGVKRVGGSGTQKGENGDLIFPLLPKNSGDNLKGNYCAELKHYKIINQSVVSKWWKKIVKQASEIDHIPILIYRQNRQKIMVRTYLHFLGYKTVGDIPYDVWKTIIKRMVIPI